jgi:uncharacterized DUF497 family protein
MVAPLTFPPPARNITGTLPASRPTIHARQDSNPQYERVPGGRSAHGGFDHPGVVMYKYTYMAYEFRWNAWNRDHAARHGISQSEAESVVSHGRIVRSADGKLKAVGRGAGGRWVQVVFVLDPDRTVFIIHARPLTDREKRRQRRSS